MSFFPTYSFTNIATFFSTFDVSNNCSYRTACGAANDSADFRTVNTTIFKAYATIFPTYRSANVSS
jgi:hypothetical protein